MEPSGARADAARYLASESGANLIREAEAMFSAGVAAHNALPRLSPAAVGLSAEASRLTAALAWTQAALRKRAVEKLGAEIAGAVLFDNEGLQMASSLAAADYHAEIARRSGAAVVVDMTAGIGIDSLVFARAGFEVVAYERDPARAALLTANVESLGLSERIQVRNVDSQAGSAVSREESKQACVYLDPPRRDETARWGKRDLAEAMLDYAVHCSPIGILMKLSPAVDDSFAAAHQSDLEFVSVSGECREALLQWGGARLYPDAAPIKSATLLPSRRRIEGQAYEQAHAVVKPCLEHARYLYEPDAAVIRAGLSGTLAAEQGWTQFDPEVAYLVSDSLSPTPFADAYAILKAVPYHQKSVQAWLSDQNTTELIVKKRGVPDEPETIRRSFKLARASAARPKKTAILALTKQGKQRWTLFLERQ